MDDLDEHGLPIWPAADRNKEPILEQLRSLIGPQVRTVFEVASGTGQHIRHFARHLPEVTFIPSDADPNHLETLSKRVSLSALPNLRRAVALDVTAPSIGLKQVDALCASAADVEQVRVDLIYNANMVHIAPWDAALGLFRVANHLLSPQKVLVTYGPYKIGGRHTSESNERFDVSLRNRDERWGVRDLDELASLAGSFGLRLAERRAMPANNFFVVWQRF